VRSTPKVVRAAVYRPIWARDGRPAAGPDEDAFTLGAAALERLARADPASALPTRLHLVGEFPAAAEWALPHVTGVAHEVRHHGSGAAGFAQAWEGTGGGPSVVLAVDLPERSEGAEGSGGACAVALRIDPTASARAPDVPESATGTEAALRYRLAAEIGVGWESSNPPRRPELDRSALAALSAIPLHSVSEGAYIPRPRYLEGTPGHWRLLAASCAPCGRRTFPASTRCAHCGSAEGVSVTELPLDGGIVVASTVIGKGGQPTEFDAQVAALGPYGVALVELAPGVRATFAVSDAPNPSLPIGTTVRTGIRRLYPMEGEWRYGRKALPD
jgi:uncharacterized OB-fold protein